MTALQRYRAMCTELEQIRKTHGGDDSPEEDALMDRMDACWWSMTGDEQSQANRDGVIANEKETG